jgi:hypothetical protein
VFYDTLQNTVLERGTSKGTWYVFNNSVDCGPLWALSSACVNILQPQDTAENNYMVTSNSTPLVAASTFTANTNLLQTPTVATADGLTENETYAYAPVSKTSPTVGAGTNLSSLCATIGATNAAAGAACMSDASYAVGYNSADNTVILAKTTNSRSSSGAWDIGAYQYASSSSTPSITSFTASPNPIALKGTSTLSWTVSGATSLSISHGNLDDYPYALNFDHLYSHRDK